MISLGGFVINGNNAGTLRACVESLQRVCDGPVLAVDSESTDGSLDLLLSLGAQVIVSKWRGFGAARMLAVSSMPPCDYVFFLDSDELLTDENVRRIQEWKKTAGSHSVYSVRRRNWVESADRRFVLFVDRRARLIKREMARWSPKMIVHEALPKGQNGATRICVEHAYASAGPLRRDKNDLYALLWAVQSFEQRRRIKSSGVQRLAHFLKRGVINGAVVRGGALALRHAWAASEYHARKYKYMRDLGEGRYSELVSLFNQGRFDEVLAKAKDSVGVPAGL